MSHAGVYNGVLSADEQQIVIMLCEAGWGAGAIGRELDRHPNTIKGFIIFRERSAALAARETAKAIEAVRAVDHDTQLIGVLWTRGDAVFSILARVRKSRQARGLPAMEIGELHRIVVVHGFMRPEPARPRIAA